MNEDCAAAAGDARSSVVVDLDNDIIKIVAALQPVATLTFSKPDRPVVASIGRVLAPGIVLRNTPKRQQSAGPRPAFRPPPQPNKPEVAARRRSVTFPFIGFDSASPERHAKPPGPGDQHAFGPVTRPWPHQDATK